MPETQYDGTIDWDQYWAAADDPVGDDANGSLQRLVGPLCAFIDERGVPDRYAQSLFASYAQDPETYFGPDSVFGPRELRRPVRARHRRRESPLV